MKESTPKTRTKPTASTILNISIGSGAEHYPQEYEQGEPVDEGSFKIPRCSLWCHSQGRKTILRNNRKFTKQVDLRRRIRNSKFDEVSSREKNILWHIGRKSRQHFQHYWHPFKYVASEWTCQTEGCSHYDFGECPFVFPLHVNCSSSCVPEYLPNGDLWDFAKSSE